MEKGKVKREEEHLTSGFATQINGTTAREVEHPIMI
jgi:hypothetical protein